MRVRMTCRTAAAGLVAIASLVVDAAPAPSAAAALRRRRDLTAV
jgi:hypothetical protein